MMREITITTPLKSSLSPQAIELVKTIHKSTACVNEMILAAAQFGIIVSLRSEDVSAIGELVDRSHTYLASVAQLVDSNGVAFARPDISKEFSSKISDALLAFNGAAAELAKIAISVTLIPNPEASAIIFEGAPLEIVIIRAIVSYDAVAADNIDDPDLEPGVVDTDESRPKFNF